MAELVLRVDRDLVGEVLLPDPLRAHEQLVHRPGDRPGQPQARKERHGPDDEEETADDGQQGKQNLADAVVADPDRGRRHPADDLRRTHPDRGRHVAGRAGFPVQHVEKGEPRPRLLKPATARHRRRLGNVLVLDARAGERWLQGPGGRDRQDGADGDAGLPLQLAQQRGGDRDVHHHGKARLGLPRKRHRPPAAQHVLAARANHQAPTHAVLVAQAQKGKGRLKQNRRANGQRG